MNRSLIVVGIISLFILSAVAPIGLGLDVKTTPHQQEEITSDGPMDSAWPMCFHDNRHTGRSSYSTADNLGIEKWRFDTENHVLGDPVIDKNGTIYVGSFDLFAIYPNGTLKWKFDSSGVVESGPAIDKSGVIYFGTANVYNIYFYAVNPDGSLKWKHKIEDSIFSSPAIGEDGSIYFGSSDGPPTGYINALNPDGTIKWRFTTAHSVASCPAIGLDGTVYCGCHDGYLYALYPSNGTLKWKFKTGGEVTKGASIADDGTIYFCSWDGYTRALYPNGTLKWKSNAFGRTIPAIGEDGTVYVGSSYLSAIDPDDGSVIWKFDPGPYRSIRGAGPAISADGTIFVGTHIGEMDGGELIAVNPDGSERWRLMLATAWIWSSPAIGEDGTVYIGVANHCPDPSLSLGYLHAIGPQESNTEPGAPVISGPSTGKVRSNIGFRISSVDPNNNPVSYFVDWGDGSDGWTDVYGSGEKPEIKHKWSQYGNYTIKAKAKDTFGLESNWTEFEIEITKSRTRTTLDFVWLRFLDAFPLLKEVILRLIR